jgi:hypothetical protein
MVVLRGGDRGLGAALHLDADVLLPIVNSFQEER